MSRKNIIAPDGWAIRGDDASSVATKSWQV